MRSNALGPGFTVAADDPAEARMDVYACQGFYEFGLAVTYKYRGTVFHELIGSAEHPSA